MPKNTSLNKQQRRAILKQINDLAWLLDNAISIPVIRYRVGLEALLGVIPGLGDIAGLLLSSIIVVQAVRLGVPQTILARMVLNIAIESLVGMIPIIGDLFDARFKANTLNVNMINQAFKDGGMEQGMGQGNDHAYVAMIMGSLIGLIGFVSGAGFAVFSWVLSRTRKNRR